MLLNKALSKKACSVLNENPARVQDDIIYIKEWILKQPHLKARMDDQWILKFLRGCKFSYEKTKFKIDKFYSLRSALPEFFTNRDPFLPEIQEILKSGSCLPLPQTDGEDGGRIIFVGTNIDSTKFRFETVLKVYLMIGDILLNEDDNYLIGGQYVIIDLKDGNLNQVFNFDLNACRRCAYCLQEGYPLRLQGVHATNVLPIFETLVSVLKQLLKKKIADRFCVYSGTGKDELTNVFPRSVLPKEYGGKSISLTELTGYWKAKVESYRSWFLEDEMYGCDETKRPVPNGDDDLFGTNGSFKLLSID